MGRRILFCAITLFGSMGRAPFSFAAQGASRVVPFEEDDFLKGVPILYSYEAGQWMSSEPAAFVSPENQAADFTLPFLKEAPEPIPYPHWALERNWEGELVVAIEVREDGTVGRWKMMRSSGYELLDQAALGAIRKWRFEPAREKGKPVASCIQIPVHFKIHEP